jgi:glycosyltransferase involved in cell wall biosynthesis
VKPRLGVVGTVIYPDNMDPSSGDVRTWLEVGEYFDDVTVIAQTQGNALRRHRVSNVHYVLLPRLPRLLDIPAFPLVAGCMALVLYGRGVRTWSFSDPLRSGLVSLLVRCLPRTHVVVHLQGQLLHMPSNRFGRATVAVEAISRFVARRADTVRVVSKDIAREAAAAGVRPTQIVVVPSRCDTELFDPGRWEEAGAAVRRALPGDPGLPVVGFLGAFNESKGLEVLVAASSKLVQRRPLRVALAGDGPLRREIERVAMTSGVPVVFLGRLSTSEVPAFLAAVDVLAVPSRDEGLPRVVLEAMAMRVPVVASRVGGIPDAVQEGVSGLLIPPGDEDAFAAALARVLDHPQLAARLGAAGRNRVLEEFEARSSWRRLAEVHRPDSLVLR